MVRNLIYIFLASLVYKILLNTARYYQVKKYKKSYQLWLGDQNNGLTVHRTEVIKLFQNANIVDKIFPFVQPLGLGQIATGNLSLFTNFPSNYEDQVLATIRSFDDAIGVYRSRIKESFSPFYWINLIIFLPRNVLCYLGAKPENVIIKILQVIWRITGLAITIFRSEIAQLIKAKVF